MKAARSLSMERIMAVSGLESFCQAGKLSDWPCWNKFESDGHLFLYLQLKEKIIPAFEATHGADYEASFFIDNSQGHSEYGEDALLISCMNIKPGGKQASMCNGWYICDGVKILQSMVYPSDHPNFPDAPKGVKAILTEHNLWQQWLWGKCEKACKLDADACCKKYILEQQPVLWFHPIHVWFHFYFSFHESLEQHAMNACSSIFTFFYA